MLILGRCNGLSASLFFSLSDKYYYLIIDTYIHLLLYLCVYVWIYWPCLYVWIVGILLFIIKGNLIGDRLFNNPKRFHRLLFARPDNFYQEGQIHINYFAVGVRFTGTR